MEKMNHFRSLFEEFAGKVRGGQVPRACACVRVRWQEQARVKLVCTPPGCRSTEGGAADSGVPACAYHVSPLPVSSWQAFPVFWGETG